MKVASIKPTISFNEFEKVDIRIGTIERVEDIYFLLSPEGTVDIFCLPRIFVQKQHPVSAV